MDTFKHTSPSSSSQVGYDMSRLAAQKCYNASGLNPSDVDVVELHDCFSANELITYEALGLCSEGEVGSPSTLTLSCFKTFRRGINTYFLIFILYDYK